MDIPKPENHEFFLMVYKRPTPIPVFTCCPYRLNKLFPAHRTPRHGLVTYNAALTGKLGAKRLIYPSAAPGYALGFGSVPTPAILTSNPLCDRFSNAFDRLTLLKNGRLLFKLVESSPKIKKTTSTPSLLKLLRGTLFCNPLLTPLKTVLAFFLNSLSPSKISAETLPCAKR